MPGVQVISRKGLVPPGRGILRDFTPDEPMSSSKIKSDLHGDMQRLAEMTSPHAPGRGATRVSEIPCRVSSDLHEWRNDLGTVSTRDTANL